MEHAIVFAIALQPHVNAEEFETYFQGSVQKVRQDEKLLEATAFSLYRPAESGKELVWITRFPAEELDRVSRAAWPFVVLAVLDVLREVRERFAADVAVLSSSVLTAEGLMDQWNQQFGRFKKLSLDPAP